MSLSVVPCANQINQNKGQPPTAQRMEASHECVPHQAGMALSLELSQGCMKHLFDGC